MSITNGTSQGLFIVVAIVIFGIFVVLANTVFGSEGLSNDLTGIFTTSIEQSEKSILRKKQTLLYTSEKETEFFSQSYTREEYVQSPLDMSEFVDVHGEGIYTLEFDLKVSKPGLVKVYTMNGLDFKYGWKYTTVAATESYRTFSLDVNVFQDSRYLDIEKSMLAFWGGSSYESSIHPTIKNIKLYKVLEE